MSGANTTSVLLLGLERAKPLHAKRNMISAEPSADHDMRGNMHELFEELEAWRPDWQQVAPRIMDAARQAGPIAEALYTQWLRTEQGAQYERLMYQIPNYAGAIKAAQESADRLPEGVAVMKD